jgi:hypothetical protein
VTTMSGNPDTLIVHRGKPGKYWGRFSASA